LFLPIKNIALEPYFVNQISITDIITSKKFKTNDMIYNNEERKMTYICRWCENNFEESGKKAPDTEYREGVLCCPRCGNITYGFLVVNERCSNYSIKKVH